MIEHLSLELIIYVILGAVIVTTTIGTIVASSPIGSAMFLVLNFFALGGIYLLNNAPFIAVVQVIVYAGAVMVLFLFAIMLLNLKELAKRKFDFYLVFALLLAFVFASQIYISVSNFIPKNVPKKESFSSINAIGKELVTTYVFPFEATSALLLLAVVGAIIITKRHTSDTK